MDSLKILQDEMLAITGPFTGYSCLSRNEHRFGWKISVNHSPMCTIALYH